MVNGIDGLAVTNLDGLDSHDEIRVCTQYDLDGEVLELPPASVEDLARVVPVYESLPGWNTDTTGARTFDDLPENALAYLERLEQLAGTQVSLVGVGPAREQTLVRG